jgi:ATP-dependent helicase/DNAse subunit B
MPEYKKEIPEEYSDRPIYSISRLETYIGCPYSYYLQYVKKEKGHNNIYALLGEHVHCMLEKAQFGEISNDEMIESFRLKMFELLQIGEYSFPSDTVKKNFTECIEHYLINYKPIICKGFKSEERFYTEIEGIVLTGFIDGIILHHDNSVTVIDYKTSSKYSAKDLESHSKQLILYAIALSNVYNINVNRICWNMLKYCQITFEGKTKQRQVFCARNEIVKKLKTELKKDLLALNKSELEVELLLEKAESTNDMLLFPKEIQDKYIITDGYVYYDLTEENKNKLHTFVKETVAKIEATPLIESAWIPKDIENEGSFFCNILCNHGDGTCKYHKEWLDSNKDNFKEKPTDNVDLLKDLFG